MRVARKLHWRPIRVNGVYVSKNRKQWTGLTEADVCKLKLYPVQGDPRRQLLPRQSVGMYFGVEFHSEYSNFRFWATKVVHRTRPGGIVWYVLARFPRDTTCYTRPPISHFRLADFRRWKQRATKAVWLHEELLPSRWRRMDLRRWARRARVAWARMRPSTPTWLEILQQLSGVTLFYRLDAELLIYIYSLATSPQLRWDGDENTNGRIFTLVCVRPRCGLIFGCRPRECFFRIHRQRRWYGNSIPVVGPVRTFYYYFDARDYAFEREDDWPWTGLYIA